MHLYIFEFRNAICVNAWLLLGQKPETVQLTMVIAWTKQVGAKGYFRHESQMGHALGQSTTVAYVY